MIRIALFLLLLVLSPGDVHAADSGIALREFSRVYMNADPSLGVEALSRPDMADRFVPVGDEPLWVGASGPVAWLKVDLPELDTKSEPIQQWILVVRPSFSIILDSLELYVPRGDGTFDRQVAGATKPGRPAETRSRYFVLELPSYAFDGAPSYLRFEGRTDVLLTLELDTAMAFFQGETPEYIAYGVLYGIFIAMVLNSVFLFASLHDRTYFYYILFILSASVWIFYVQGFAKLLFGPTPPFDRTILWFTIGSMITWGAVFSTRFLRIKEGSPFLLYVFMIVAGFGAVTSIAALFGAFSISFTLSHYLGLILPVLVIVTAVIRLIQGFPSAFHFLLAWIFLAIGGSLFAMMGLKILPVNFITTNGIAIGMATEAILLSIALSDRFRLLQVETKRLEKIQEQYRELSLTDALTGLHNKRFFMAELRLAVEQSRTLGTPLSLILLDIDGFKQVNDIFGHAIGDEVLATLARCMRGFTRESDKSCRIGGDEMVIILPSMTIKGATDVAERIRMQFAEECRRAPDGRILNASLSLGTVQYNGTESAEAFLARADGAMYEAKRQGKNRSIAR